MGAKPASMHECACLCVFWKPCVILGCCNYLYSAGLLLISQVYHDRSYFAFFFSLEGGSGFNEAVYRAAQSYLTLNHSHDANLYGSFKNWDCTFKCGCFFLWLLGGFPQCSIYIYHKSYAWDCKTVSGHVYYTLCLVY